MKENAVSWYRREERKKRRNRENLITYLSPSARHQVSPVFPEKRECPAWISIREQNASKRKGAESVSRTNSHTRNVVINTPGHGFSKRKTGQVQTKKEGKGGGFPECTHLERGTIRPASEETEISS